MESDRSPDLGYDVGTDRESVSQAITAFREKYESRVGHASGGTSYEVPLYAEIDEFFRLVETVDRDTITAQVTGPYASLFRPLIGYRFHTDTTETIKWDGVEALIEARDSGAYADQETAHWGGTHIESWKWQFKNYFQDVVWTEFDLTELTAEDVPRFFETLENPTEEFDAVSNVPAQMMGGQFHRLARREIVDHCHENPTKAAAVLGDLFDEDLGIIDRLNEFYEFCRHLTTKEENKRGPGSLLRAATALLMYAYPEHHITFQYQRLDDFFDQYSTADGVEMGFNAQQYREVTIASRDLLEKIKDRTGDASMIDVQTLIYVANDA